MKYDPSKWTLAMGFAALTGFSSPAWASTATGNLSVRITIVSECKVVATPDLSFGSHGIIDDNVEAKSALTVQCTTGTPYTIGLGLGTGTGASQAARKLTGPVMAPGTTPSAATINYNLYQDAAYAQVWGDGTKGAGSDVSKTGNGDPQDYTVYGRIGRQTTPAAGAYADTVAVTVSY